jgi:hypothetical protein
VFAALEDMISAAGVAFLEFASLEDLNPAACADEPAVEERNQN